jgi:choloylglycine hydrolase
MCTFFRYKNGVSHFVGKNYDVPSPCYGLIFWNPAGLKKRALIKPPEVPVEWVSKYGNITFNQVGRDFPASGMNEKGLIVEQTTLWNTIYPDRDNRKAIKELQLIQYLLDVCSSTKESIECIENVRVSQEMAKLQYIISDREGNICLAEFILGEMKVYSNNDFAYQVITNDMIGTSIDYLNIHIGFGGTKSAQFSKYSLDRFVVTIEAIQNGFKSDSTPSVFKLLNLSKYDDTQWQIVYNLKDLSIKWRRKVNDRINELRLSDFVNKDECIILELDTAEKNKYSKSRNLILANRFFKESTYFGGIKIKDNDIEILASISE